jgi:hypothetical protein
MLLAVVASSCVGGGAGSIATARSLPELVSQSDVIILGVVRSQAGTRNLARDLDRTRESSTLVVEGQDYAVQVEDVLKGFVGDMVIVSLAKSHGVRDKAIRQDEDFRPFSIGGRYVLFLGRIPGTDAYGQIPEPFQFRVAADVRPESKWAEAERFFPARPLVQFLTEIRTAVTNR